MKTILAAAVFAFSVSASALAQQPNWSQPGDYYPPASTVVQQPAPQSQVKEGDYYPAGTTIVQQPTPQQLNQSRQGDYYAPDNSH